MWCHQSLAIQGRVGSERSIHLQAGKSLKVLLAYLYSPEKNVGVFAEPFVFASALSAQLRIALRF